MYTDSAIGHTMVEPLNYAYCQVLRYCLLCRSVPEYWLIPGCTDMFLLHLVNMAINLVNSLRW